MAHQEELHDDDIPVGRLLTRREALALFGGAGVVALFAGTSLTRLAMAQATPAATATSIPTCVVKPALTEGPYFVDGVLNRSDIRLKSDGTLKEGAQLKLKFRVSDVSGGVCSPLEGAQVDIWHCDADGEYSGVTDTGFDNTEEIWLRGYQVTDSSGVAEFVTIYPGWYSGRAVHIHFKIRTDPESETGYEYTSQLFFDPDLTEQVYSVAPYDKGLPDTPNDSDGIYQGSEGLLTLDITEDDEGYTATFDIGLDLSQPAEEVGMGGGPGAGNPGGTPPGGGGRPGGNPPGGTPPGRP